MSLRDRSLLPPPGAQESKEDDEMEGRFQRYFANIQSMETEVLEKQRLTRPWPHVAVDLSNPQLRLYWIKHDADYCAGQSHFTASFSCLAAEAMYLRRTLVLRTTICLFGVHNGGVTVVRPMDDYYDLAALSRHLPWVSEHDFSVAKQKDPNVTITFKEFGLEVPTEKLRRFGHIQFLMRNVPASSSDWRYAYEVCQRPHSPIQRFRKNVLEPCEELRKIIDNIVLYLGKGYVSLHVRRGDKLDPSRWPNLDRDTQPEAILKKLEGTVPVGSKVYLLTNEKAPGFFDPLKQVYSLFCLDDFAHLWANESSWFNWFQTTFEEEPIFDVRMKVIVDYAVRNKARKRIETFNDLTSDPGTGITPS